MSLKRIENFEYLRKDAPLTAAVLITIKKKEKEFVAQHGGVSPRTILESPGAAAELSALYTLYFLYGVPEFALAGLKYLWEFAHGRR